MPDITAAVTRKLGPAPVWLWLVALGGGLWLVSRSGVFGKGATPATPSQQPAAAPTSGTNNENAGAQLQGELGLLQQLQSFQQQSFQNNLEQVQQTQQTQQQLSPPSQGAQVATVRPWAQGQPWFTGTGVWLYGDPSSQGSRIATVPTGAQVKVTGPAVSGSPAGDPGHTTLYYPVQWGTGSGFLSAADISGFQGGPDPEGGPSIPAPFHAITGRPSLGAAHSIWRSGHPMLRAGGAGPMYPHYASGGPRHAVTIGNAVGMHPARVLAANGGLRRGQAAPGQIVRVS